ncbi:MAG: hypothetical protein J6L00_01185 [Clostridia bacterium]|nr:hypothetical protein [Clostridia bacterium]
MMEAQKKTTKKKENVHSGHRQRVKERFMNEGLESFEPHQVLEMLLFFGVHMKDTNELAHRLLNSFGSLYRVLEASFEDLKQVEGVTDNVATLICFSGQLVKRYWVERCDIGTILDTSQKIGEYFKYRFAGDQEERVLLMSLDNRKKLLNCTCIAKGSVNAADINVRLAVKQALKDNATLVALAHNHPNGHAYPSNIDIRTTEIFAKAFSVLDIHLIDHIVVSEDDFISMAETKQLTALFGSRRCLTNDDTAE